MKKNEKNEDVYEEPSVFAVPCDIPFVVDASKAKEFNELECNTELLEKIKEASEKLNIKVELEPIEPEIIVLKKVKK